MKSIYWYDYETFGIDPRQDRIAQFAGLRTDEDLNIIGDPLVIYCKPAADMLPDPQACLITGITPQKADAEGLIEAEFIAAIHEQFATPGTCVAGFNNIRFDDEFTRNTLYRNFYNPYAHEWQNGNSRWDIIDMVRLTRALRPEGIEWPVDENGKPSIRLERLTAANGISHEAAHDAMSDVYATIEVARLIRDRQPKLYDYIYGLRRKQQAARQFNLHTREAVLHVSSKYSSERHAIAMVMPICMHPVNKNGVVVYDLATDPHDFLHCDAGEITARLYTRKDELPENVERIPLKVVHLNKCPVVVPLKTLDGTGADRLGIDVDTQLARRDTILQHIDDLVAKTGEVFRHNPFEPATDPDLMLYSGGFFSDADQARMDTIRHTAPAELARLALRFDDARLPEMLFRYRARNYPDTLNAEEQQQWREFCQQRFSDPAQGPRTLAGLLAEIENLQNREQITGSELVILQELEQYAKEIEQTSLP